MSASFCPPELATPRSSQILVGDERLALEATAALLERGIYAQAIRPPTVPAGTARLRVALTAGHERDHVDQLLAALDDLVGARVIPRLS